MQIEGSVAFVTGANRGVGAAFVDALLARGARKVYAGARNGSAARADARVQPVQLDITRHEQVHAAAEAASDTTLLINNAGINRLRGVLADDTLEAARAEMEVNYFGTLAMIRAFAPALVRGEGAIVNMLSILARVALPPMGSLCASKAAALRMSESVRAELGPRGVRVMAVLPGAIDTEMSRDFPPPKLATADVVSAVLDALAQPVDELHVGEMAQQIAAGLAADRGAVQRYLASLG
ncbi:MAG: SDR family oxidoreductase [Burkholderia sp.]